jgi:NAD(P)-dependent dehydrogenase (short-subunit alcohol dehydrogenase family)
MARNDRFTDKVVFITGAASGIGRAAALAFAAEGARVAILDRSADALEEVKTSVKNAGAEVMAIACDVSSPEQVQAAVRQIVDRFGRLDVAVLHTGPRDVLDRLVVNCEQQKAPRMTRSAERRAARRDIRWSPSQFVTARKTQPVCDILTV